MGGSAAYIGRYRADRVIGSGAFATVWLAEDETLGAPVAIKVLAENWAHDDEVRQRFLEEARILWRADSDHIVRIHNVDTLPDGRPYFVMDFADRGTLLQRMRGRIDSGARYSVAEAIELSVAIADGLKVAHGLGVVHRDLKPANIMFQSVPAHHGGECDEKLILTDFGMAKSVARSRGTTIATGTPHYMAPEQTEGKADERSDIYSAGVVLYELLAGRVPYPYDSPGRLFAAQVSEPPTPIVQIRDDIPAPLADTLQRALATDPARRWPSAEAWANALQKAPGEALESILPGVEPDSLRTMAPAEIAAAKAESAGPPTSTSTQAPAGGDGRRRRRKRGLAIGLPVGAAVAAVAAIIFALVLTGSSTADARTLTLQPVSGLGLNPFTRSVVPTVDTPISQLQIPKNFNGKLPQALIGSSSISNEDLFGRLTRIDHTLLQNLNPRIGAISQLQLPQGAFRPSSNGRPQVFAGDAPGLYGGTQLLTVCDKRAMIAFLERNTDKLRAWAAVQGISPGDVARYISRLTDVVLRFDTRVTNHGYLNGAATTIDEVLQKGTAVLIDEYGIPRARCYCGNPLTPPRRLVSRPKIKGAGWPGFSLGKTVEPNKTKKAPEVGLVDVVTGNTAVYKKAGASPEETTLTPQLIDPLPGSKTPPVVTVPSGTTPAPATGTLAFAGFDDRVGTRTNSTPDGSPDAHFVLTISVSAPTSVKDIALRTADPSGQPCCGQVWNTTVDSYWILAVYRGSTRLNPSDRNISDPVSQAVTYDLYAGNSGYFTSGQRFLATVTLGDGKKVEALTTMTRSPGATGATGATGPAGPSGQTGKTFGGTISAKADIYLAGGGGITNPGTPPAAVPVKPGDVVRFTSVTGLTSAAGPSVSIGPDGAAGATNLDAHGGLSGISAPTHLFLAGVFVGPGTATGTPPAPFTSSAVRQQPGLQQVFFIGDGRTASRAVQEFVVPTGATTLVLGIADGYSFQGAPGWYDDNAGSYHVTLVVGGSAAPAGGTDEQQAVALVTAVLEKQKSACSMTWSQVTASAITGGWTVKASVVTSGNPGTAIFGVRGTTVTAADPLSAEILAGCA